MGKDTGEYNLTHGVVWKVMFTFTVPIFLGIFFQSLYTTIDAIIIGRFAGASGLAAIESVEKLIKIPLNFFVGLSSAATIIISQYFGAEEDRKLSEAVHNAISFAFVGGLILSVAAAVVSPYFVKVIKVPVEIQENAQKYLWIYFAGLAVFMVYNVGAGILRAVGDSKTPFYFIIASNCINIMLDLIFVGFLQWGISGAAFATILAELSAAVMTIFCLIRTDMTCKVYPGKLKFYRSHMKDIFRIGMPIGVQSTLFPISNMIVQTNINALGVNCIAAWAICGKLDFFVWYISEAFGISVSTFTAQNYGAGKRDRIGPGVKAGIIYSVTSVGLVSLLLYLFIVPLAGLFVDDRIIIGLASEMMAFIVPYYFLYALCEIFPGAIKGTGETFRPMIVTLIFTCLSRIIWVSFIPIDSRTFRSVLFCYPLSWMLTAIAFTVYYFIYFKGNKSCHN